MAVRAGKRPVDWPACRRNLVGNMPVCISDARIGAAREQRLGHGDLAPAAAALDGRMEGRVPIGVFAIRIGSSVDQQRGGAATVRSRPDKQLQGREAGTICQCRIGSAVEQDPYGAGPAQIGPEGNMKRRIPFAILAVGVRAGAKKRRNAAG